MNYHVVAAHTAHGSAIIPVGTTVSVHGLRPSPFPSLNSIFLYIVADLQGFVKEMGVLFTIRLLTKGEKDKKVVGRGGRRAVETSAPTV